MHDNGADIRFIQAMLGHSKLTTTEIYTQVSIKKLKEIHTATHPARLKGDSQPKKRKRKPKAEKPTEPAPEGKTEAESVQSYPLRQAGLCSFARSRFGESVHQGEGER